MIEKIDKLLLGLLADEKTNPTLWLAQRHPGVQVLLLLSYLFTIASLSRYEVIGLLPFILYPAFIFYFAEMPLKVIGRKLLVVEPFILFVAILNPLLDAQTINLMGVTLSAGWLTLVSLILKSLLTLTVAFQLSMLLGIDGLCLGLAGLKFPTFFVTVMGMMYRYLTVLAEETVALSRAYRLRAPKHKGIHVSVWGSFAGQLILRCYDRAQRIEQAMAMRGYTGQLKTNTKTLERQDWIYGAAGLLYLIICRLLVEL